MFGKRISIVAARGMLTLACAWIVMDRHAVADEPGPVLRTFGVWWGWWDSPPPDFRSDDSIAVIVTEDGNPSILGPELLLGGSGCSAPWAGTRWVEHSARHVERGGLPPARYFWLQTDETPGAPPVGAHTFTGAGSPLILSQTVYALRSSEQGDGCSSSDEITAGAYRAVPIELGVAGAVGVFVVVEALFSE